MASISYTLYIATNTVNGKQYVGLSKEFHKRIVHHKCASTSSVFHKAIKEYGFDKFAFSSIAEARDLSAACDLERLLIQQHNTLTPNGYNMTVGGQVGPVGYRHSAETKQKISEANRNRPKEARDTFAKAQKGKIRSQEFKDMVSVTSTGRKHSPESIAKIKASWVKRKQAKTIAATLINNFMNKEAPHGVSS